ncbi:hypothetical protein STEG23_030215 [Scotinomys teguina]
MLGPGARRSAATQLSGFRQPGGAECACECNDCGGQKRAADSLGIGVTGSSESPDMDTGTPTLVFCKSLLLLSIQLLPASAKPAGLVWACLNPKSRYLHNVSFLCPKAQ